MKRKQRIASNVAKVLTHKKITQDTHIKLESDNDPVYLDVQIYRDVNDSMWKAKDILWKCSKTITFHAMYLDITFLSIGKDYIPLDFNGPVTVKANTTMTISFPDNNVLTIN